MTQRAFTLIELMMVIAIIGLLSTIVLGSLREARLKGADAAVMQQAQQLRNLMELQRSDTGSYAGIKQGGGGTGPGGFKIANSTCLPANFAAGTYRNKAAEVCTALVKASSPYCGTECLYFLSTNPTSQTAFTIMAYLPAASAAAGVPRYICMGSSNAQSVVSQTGDGTWPEAGCYSNP